MDTVCVTGVFTIAFHFYLPYLFKQPSLNQGGLNKKEIQLNLCNMFSILIFNEFYFFP